MSALNYEQLKQDAESCTKCELSKTRIKVVFGSGPVPCDLMLIGEGPGADEDIQGIPFVGRAGQLLSKIFESVGIVRDSDVYIANTVKCRPPENRAPLKPEIDACYPYLKRQIEIINPKIILLAGSPATKVILKHDGPMGAVRGKWFKLEGTEISVMPIFHPAYLLRNPVSAKGSPKWQTWQDMIEVKNALDLIKKVKEMGA